MALHSGERAYGIAAVPVSGGILDVALTSRVQGHKRIETPDLDVRYEPPRDSGFLRGDETNPAIE